MELATGELHRGLYVKNEEGEMVPYYEVLMTRRDSLEAEMELVEAKKAQLQAIVSIYQALGGGWRREP